MAPSLPNCRNLKVPRDISFSGSGFLATYQLGVALCFFMYAPWILRSAVCILGASAGSLIATAVVCEMNMFAIRDEILQFAKHVTSFILGPFDPSIKVANWLERLLHKYLPPDAHRWARGRLGIAVTRVTDGKQLILSDFNSKEDIVQALLCSCFVPGLSGYLPPSFRGEHYIDGGLSNIQPMLPDSSDVTLTVSPFSGDADICPADPPCSLEMVVGTAVLQFSKMNNFRILNGLYPTDLRTIEQAFYNGFKDAIRFLQINDLVPSAMNEGAEMTLRDGQTNMWKYLEASKAELEDLEMKVENTAMESYSSMWTDSSTEPQLFRDSHFHFDVVKNVLLGNASTYLSMLRLPARILSNLLLPLVVSFYALLQSRQRMELVFRQLPEFVFWTWHGARQCFLFLFNIVVQTLKKDMEKRVMNCLLFLQWLNVYSHYGK
uniref:Patatin-like phospholipase domain-containing protein 2 n=1 Tax=Oryzias latipes TaxID=8090 RepID=A0A3P9IJP2_ORYLA